MNTIVGRITKNAEINTLKNDKQVVNFSVATNDSYKTKDGERREQTTYYNCSYWISSNVAKILTKGSLVELSGRISSSAWIGKDGEIKSGLNFHTSKIKLHGGGKRSETGEAEINQSQPSSNQFAQNTQNTNPLAGETDDDLPF
ncbi:single-stranded DNA-binding protein [Elizabethkingia anophelis]|uniref:single-stranded DNA-binding protein n=1 Tax=Elizabethkingia TaxID=308865 RepID=UPI000739980F|nr:MULTISPECIES: single-stranded DNA-binding protein [Elizabethkingia]KUF42365.1 single-stranded DNA-binding protein [Elizabethkingia anophelis]MCT3657121.1 single-stranded DNA-binding protein [Elizabethkingia anophelis]MCT3711335.1 single-stranded DNA-binding protein [Elizabethkingia anophelis]MCT3903769.1 single-stranded DNA-binding protein [Elizabethkingia anophelis]MCT3935936.1 single-stranded DNA-binding protein [Elizabethkingia anophelis]